MPDLLFTTALGMTAATLRRWDGLLRGGFRVLVTRLTHRLLWAYWEYCQPTTCDHRRPGRLTSGLILDRRRGGGPILHSERSLPTGARATLIAVTQSPEPAAAEPAGPPPLPPVRSGLAHLVVPATGIWFVGFLVMLFFIGPLREHHAMNWLWTFLSGWVLGLIGLSIYFWQRHAARRGTRGSSSMALDEEL